MLSWMFLTLLAGWSVQGFNIKVPCRTVSKSKSRRVNRNNCIRCITHLLNICASSDWKASPTNNLSVTTRHQYVTNWLSDSFLVVTMLSILLRYAVPTLKYLLRSHSDVVIYHTTQNTFLSFVFLDSTDNGIALCGRGLLSLLPCTSWNKSARGRRIHITRWRCDLIAVRHARHQVGRARGFCRSLTQSL